MKITRKMVAERAGVTKESVSYVLNRSRPVSNEIVKKVMEAVEELGYVPDVAARSLRDKGSMSIGVICNDLSNPYYAEIINGIDEAAQEAGYTVLVVGADGHIRKKIQNFTVRRVDGIVFLAFPDKMDYDVETLATEKIAFVVSHNVAYVGKSGAHLEPNFPNGFDETMSAIKDAGHLKIAYLSAFGEDCTYDDRLESFKAAHRKYFQAEPQVFFADCVDTTVENGRRLVEKYFDELKEYTVILTSNDMMAIGCMQALKKRGVRIPEDMSVVGVDNMMFSELVTPSLATIGYDKKAYGKRLFQLLLKNIEDKIVVFERFPMQFLKRESLRVIEK